LVYVVFEMRERGRVEGGAEGGVLAHVAEAFG
jgi:hypothetical protein